MPRIDQPPARCGESRRQAANRATHRAGAPSTAWRAIAFLRTAPPQAAYAPAAALVVFIRAPVCRLAGRRIDGRTPSFLDRVRFLRSGSIWPLAGLRR